MELRAEEISRIIKSQIKDYEAKTEVAETGTVLSLATASPAFTGWSALRPVNLWSLAMAPKGWF